MFTIILGMVIIVLLVAFIWRFNKFSIISAIGVCAIAIVMFGMAAITTYPIHGYGERIISEEIDIALLTIDGKMDIGNMVYLSVSGDEAYSYKVKGNNEVSVINKGEYEISYIESEECKKAVLRVYERKAKNSLFNFSRATKNEYEFYIPIDSVQEIT